MNLDMFDRRRAERFAQLLDEHNGGPRHHARGQADEQLTELVAVGRTLSAVRPAIQVDPEFRTGLRAMLVATAERDGIGADASTETAPGSHVAIRDPRRNGILGSGAGRRIRARGAIVLGVAAGALAVSGISAASENAVPGDVFYGVKRSTERAQLAMAGSDVTRGQLSLNFARTRLAEAADLDGDESSFPAVLDDMDNDTRQGVRLLATSAVTRRDSTTLATIDAFVTDQRGVFASMLNRLNPANTERAKASTSLLDDITRRVDSLRATLQCDKDATSGTDSLGPKPQPCGVASGATAPDDEPQDKGGTSKESGTGTGPDETPATAEPSRSAANPQGDPGAPVGGSATTGDVNRPRPGGPTTAPTTDPEPTNAPNSDPDDGGLLPGLPDLLGG